MLHLYWSSLIVSRRPGFESYAFNFIQILKKMKMSIDEPLNYLFILNLAPEPYPCACPRCGHMEAQMEPRHVPHLLHNA